MLLIRKELQSFYLAWRVERLRTSGELRVHSTTEPREGDGRAGEGLRVERCSKKINLERRDEE